MHVEISENIYRTIAALHGDVSAFVENAARQALQTKKPVKKPKFDAEQLLSEFRDLEGMFGEASLDEVLSDRRYGIE